MLLRNLSFNKLEISIGVSHGSLSNAWKHKKNIGSQVIKKILDRYPEISSEWLFRGQGPMLLSKIDDIPNLPSEDDNFNLDDVLIDLSLQFFNVESKKGLYEVLCQSDATLEKIILGTWEKKYGQDLIRINRQLMTLFNSKLSNEMKSQNSQDSKTG